MLGRPRPGKPWLPVSSTRWGRTPGSRLPLFLPVSSVRDRCQKPNSSYDHWRRLPPCPLAGEAHHLLRVHQRQIWSAAVAGCGLRFGIQFLRCSRPEMGNMWMSIWALEAGNSPDTYVTSPAKWPVSEPNERAFHVECINLPVENVSRHFAWLCLCLMCIYIERLSTCVPFWIPDLSEDGL